MKEFLGMLCLSLFITACGGLSDDETAAGKAAMLQEAVETGCNVTPVLGDLLAVVVHPGFAGVSITAKLICNQYLKKTGSLERLGAITLIQDKEDGCIAVVNGICIRKEE